MTAEHRLIPDDTSRPRDSLVEALRRWRKVDESAAEPVVAGLRVIDADRPRTGA